MKTYTAIALLLLFCVPTFAESVTIKVSAGKYNRRNSIVTTQLPKFLRGKPLRLLRADNGKAIYARSPYKRPQELVWILDEAIASGSSRKYRIEVAKPGGKVPKSDDWVHIDGNSKGAVIMKYRNKTILHYNPMMVPSPIKGKPYYQRSGYIHPVFNPAGQPVTDDFAPDHPHQHGIMHPFVRTKFQGRSLNFWEQSPGVGGLIISNGVVAHTAGIVFASVHARLLHMDRTDKKNLKKVLKEEWHIRAYAFDKEFIFDLESRLSCATKTPLNVLKHHYGGLAIRGNRGWKKDLGNFLTSEGKTRKNGNHTAARWVDINGKVKGKHTGLTVFSHPKNFRAPQPVRLHPSMPYFCYAPMVKGSFKIKPQQTYVSRYRFYTHMGKLNVKRAEAIWADYAFPVQCLVVK